MSMTPAQVAEAAYAAMCEPPPHVVLYNAVRTATDGFTGTELLRNASAELRDAATQWAMQPDINERDRRLAWLREDPRRLGAVRAYYAEHLAQFISDFGMTVDPRLIAKGKHALIPLRLWPKQVQLVEWMLARFAGGEPGVVVKSRDVGASWVSMALLGSLCIFRPNFAAGVASATETKLDRSGDPDTLFFKLREFLKHLPPELNGGYNPEKNSQYLRVSFPLSGSSVTGEPGDQAGRGSRKSLYIVDEAAHFEHPKLIEASLAATTDCCLWMSSVNGIGGSFYEKAHNAAVPRFDLTWRDDPRKDDAWYAQKAATLNPVIVAQEIDCNFGASTEGVVIPSHWVQAAIGLHERLGIAPTGVRMAALDVADRGVDRNAMAFRYGCLLEHVESWSGKTGDIFQTTAKAFRLCDERGLTAFDYDEDGMGAGVRGDARVLNEGRAKITATAYRGSSAPMFPDALVPRTNRKNADFYGNRKAQSWWHLRMLFNESYKASRGEPYDPEAFISINPIIPELARLVAELSQATVSQTASGKLVIDKIGDDGGKSPDLADAVVIAFAPRKMPLKISDNLLLADFPGRASYSDVGGGGARRDYGGMRIHGSLLDSGAHGASRMQDITANPAVLDFLRQPYTINKG